MKAWLKTFIERPQNMMELGPTVMVDLNEVSAVYKEGFDLTIRIGGMGVIKLNSRQLFGTVESTYAEMAERLVK